MAAAPERVDALAATRELLADLPRLLVEPLSLVIDDAEHLVGADESLELLSEMIRAEPGSVHVAIASRRPLELRVAKPQATGRLTGWARPISRSTPRSALPCCARAAGPIRRLKRSSA